MPKKDNLPMSGYVPDIKSNKSFLQTYNRHSDSYSVFDLSPEIILISSRLSQLLCELDDQDPSLLSHSWSEIMSLIECKRKLIETVSKASEVAFKQKQTQRLNDARIKWMGGTKILIDDLKDVVRTVEDVLENYLTTEQLEEFRNYMAVKLTQVENERSEFR